MEYFQTASEFGFHTVYTAFRKLIEAAGHANIHMLGYKTSLADTEYLQQHSASKWCLIQKKKKLYVGKHLNEIMK